MSTRRRRRPEQPGPEETTHHRPVPVIIPRLMIFFNLFRFRFAASLLLCLIYNQSYAGTSLPFRYVIFDLIEHPQPLCRLILSVPLVGNDSLLDANLNLLKLENVVLYHDTDC